MPGLSGGVNTSAVTLYRRSLLILDVDEAVLARPVTGVSRYSHEIARATQAGVGSSQDVDLSSSGPWTLKPVQHTNGWNELTKWQDAILRLSLWATIPGFAERANWRAPSLPGVTPDVGVAATGDHFMQRQVPSGSNWGGVELGSDAAAHPKPVLPSANVPMRRMAASTPVFDSDTGFHLRAQFPNTRLHAPDNLFTLYHGGPNGPSSVGGGEFATALLGSGLAQLYERVKQGGTALWNKVMEFRFAAPNAVAGRTHSITLQPLGRGMMNMLAAPSDRAQGDGRSMIAGPRFAPPPPNPHAANFVVSPLVSGYSPRQTTTGPGQVRVDHREDHRPLWQVSQLVYPKTGLVEDHIFVAPLPMKAGTEMILRLKGNVPAGNVARDPAGDPWGGLPALEGVIYDADTRIALSPSSTGHDPAKLLWRYRSNANQQQYYVRITFRDDTRHTPTLEGFEVEIASQVTERTGLKIATDVAAVNISYGDSDPSHETAEILIHDVAHNLGILQTRAGIHSRLTTQYDATDPTRTFVLLDGELLTADADLWGMETGAGLGSVGSQIEYPSIDWRDFHCTFTGLWARWAAQLVFFRKSFAVDENAPLAADGTPQAWKVTDIIRWVALNCLGLPSDMVDVPDNPIRLLAIGNPEDYLLEPTQAPLDYISRLAHDYLAAFLRWDMNAGTRGMLRLGYQAVPSYNVLWNFVFSGPPGKFPHFEESYPTATTFVQRGHFRTRVQKAEGNYVAVSSTGQTLPDGSGVTKTFAFGINEKSFDFFPDNPTADPTHPDFLGYFAPIVAYDRNLGPLGVVAFAKRLLDFACHAQKWAWWRSPLVHLNDPTDAKLGSHRRPLRHQDVVTLQGEQFVIQDVHPEYSAAEGGDDFQMAVYSAVSAP